jgi:hypothetical protein
MSEIWFAAARLVLRRLHHLPRLLGERGVCGQLAQRA